MPVNWMFGLLGSVIIAASADHETSDDIKFNKDEKRHSLFGGKESKESAQSKKSTEERPHKDLVKSADDEDLDEGEDEVGELKEPALPFLSELGARQPKIPPRSKAIRPGPCHRGRQNIALLFPLSRRGTSGGVEGSLDFRFEIGRQCQPSLGRFV